MREKRELYNQVKEIEKNLNKFDGLKYSVTTHSDYVTIKIATRKSKCYGCDSVQYKETLVIRQDKRVTGLFVPRRFCNSCVKVVDELISNLKDTVPQHLANLR
tara:strand:+ start:298 stop:606 length:309 start_codon:yes stop_codon:yes gene_type:complete